MINRIVLTASAFAVLAAAANAQVPFLSFSDNESITATRTNTSATTSTFTAAGTGYEDIVTASTTPLTSVSYILNGTLLGSAGAGQNPEEDNLTTGGSIDVVDSVLGLLFTVSFDSGLLNGAGFGASDADGDNVVYSNINSALAGSITNTATGDAFGFSFANATTNGNVITYSTQGQFSSTPVPEPTTMAALGLGAVAMLRRRRKA